MEFADNETLADQIMNLVYSEIDAINDDHMTEIRELEAQIEDRDSR